MALSHADNNDFKYFGTEYLFTFRVMISVKIKWQSISDNCR
jgi:hypothetical protein